MYGGDVEVNIPSGARKIKVHVNGLLSASECESVVHGILSNIPASGNGCIDLIMPPAILAQIATAQSWPMLLIISKYRLVVTPKPSNHDANTNLLACPSAVSPVEVDVNLAQLRSHRFLEISRLFVAVRNKVHHLVYDSFQGAFVDPSSTVLEVKIPENDIISFKADLFVTADICKAIKYDPDDEYFVTADFSLDKNTVQKKWSFKNNDIQENDNYGLAEVACVGGSTDRFLIKDGRAELNYLKHAIVTLKGVMAQCDDVSDEAAVKMVVTGKSLLKEHTLYTDKTEFEFIESNDIEGDSRWSIFEKNRQYNLRKNDTATLPAPFEGPNPPTQRYKITTYYTDKKATGLFLAGEAFTKFKNDLGNWGTQTITPLAQLHYDLNILSGNKDKVVGIMVKYCGMTSDSSFEDPLKTYYNYGYYSYWSGPEGAPVTEWYNELRKIKGDNGYKKVFELGLEEYELYDDGNKESWESQALYENFQKQPEIGEYSDDVFGITPGKGAITYKGVAV